MSVICFMHLKSHGLFWFPCARVVGFCLSLVDMLVGLLVALFVGFGCCVALWFLPYMWGPVSGCCPFPRFLGKVLSVFYFSLGSLLALVYCSFGALPFFGNKFLTIQKKKKKKT